MTARSPKLLLPSIPANTTVALLGPDGLDALADSIAQRLRPTLAMGADAILTPAEAAQTLGVAIATLERWRSQGTGPAYVWLGRRKIGYRIGSVRVWVQDNHKDKK
ncbi:helix-turn-helix transcriptional regulator [Labrys okinawensis]|uniref:helix-turn-helix transcriptional regulator n=1 Tax=Labrys okinawensis TaxID=346911 RepID=UPI0039BC4942